MLIPTGFSYRDLPVLLNVEQCRALGIAHKIFLRTLEFYWQEGHTAHASTEEAQERTMMMLDAYTDFAVNRSCRSRHTGRKSDWNASPVLTVRSQLKR